MALVLWTLALFLCLALASYRGDPSGSVLTTPTAAGGDWVGPVGSMCARALVSLVGVVAWGLPLELVLLGIPLVRGKDSPATPGRIAGDILITVVTAALFQVAGPGRTAFGTFAAGGGVGEIFGELARSLFSTAGSFLVGFACLGLILIGRAAFSFIALARLVARLSRRIAATWTAFARNGKPDNPAIPHWAPYTASDRATLVLDRECRVENDYGREARLFWKDVTGT